ncbi:DUF3180 domain-containing protein [Nocardiopsis suaedae]|uniref:DUF3180 domain-containing protein n=1 Tax=Nocardiopsis suaedae TaxID=3018444 RepID=A0ABT4TMM0_9ACTN|nr:DUF3180 domain-containing protein [Nocardiopsis suaedae]MDA2805640.1 DUF3180 domain-containing protein [Nocardiopsis suaedae]
MSHDDQEWGRDEPDTGSGRGRGGPGGPDDERRMHPIGWKVPIAVAVASALAAYPLVAAFYGELPPLPWTAVPTLLLLAVGEAITGYHTRRRIRRDPGTEPVEPLSAARLVALAKASALVASLVVGVFAGMAVYLGGRLQTPLPREDFFTSLGTMAAGIVLFGAAVFLEWACRVPDDDSEGEPGRA